MCGQLNSTQRSNDQFINQTSTYKLPHCYIYTFKYPAVLSHVPLCLPIPHSAIILHFVGTQIITPPSPPWECIIPPMPQPVASQTQTVQEPAQGQGPRTAPCTARRRPSRTPGSASRGCRSPPGTPSTAAASRTTYRCRA